MSSKYKSQKGFAHIFILVVIVIFSIAGIGYWMYKNGQIKSIPSQNQSEVTSSPTPVENETANWKTHTNNDFKFSIEYPSTWIVEESNPISPFITIYLNNSTANLIISPIGEARFTSDRNRNQKLSNGNSIIFAGRSAKEYYNEFAISEVNMLERDIHIENKENLLWDNSNEISYRVEKSDVETRKTFDQILSTFKFMENVSETDTNAVCQEAQRKVTNLIDQANYCQNDSDCTISDTPFGCPFGCYQLINKNADLNNVLEAKVEYETLKCGQCLYDCINSPAQTDIKCINNKCFDIRFN